MKEEEGAAAEKKKLYKFCNDENRETKNLNNIYPKIEKTGSTRKCIRVTV